MTTPVLYDERAEQSVIGAILHNPDVFSDMPALKAEHFFRPAHELLFRRLQQMHTVGEEIDSVTVFAKLREHGELQKIGGAPYLSDLLQAFKTIDSAPAYANIVVQQWQLRKLHEFGNKCLTVTRDADDVPLAVQKIREFLDDIDATESTEAESFPELFDRWVNWQESDEELIPTPWDEINDTLSGGLGRGRLYIAAGRPGGGKSILGQNILLDAAQNGYSALSYSLEMSKAEVTARILAAGANVKFRSMICRNLSRDEYERIQQFREKWAGMNLTISDAPSPTIEQIIAEATAHKRKHGLDVLFLDYAGLIAPSDPKQSRYLQMGHISRQSKALARRLDCAVVLAAQLSRGVESEQRNPRMSDLRESGDLESDADCVIILAKGVNEHEGMIRVHIPKNRQGVPDRIIDLEQRYHVMRLGL